PYPGVTFCAPDIFYAVFQDSPDDPASDFTATFDWGDGTTSTAAIIGPHDNWFTLDPWGSILHNPNDFAATAKHQYATSDVPYHVTATVTSKTGDTVTAASDFTPPGETLGGSYLVVTAANIALAEDQLFSGVVGTVTDTRPD